MVISKLGSNFYLLKGIKIYKINASNFWQIFYKSIFAQLKDFWAKM